MANLANGIVMAGWLSAATWAAAAAAADAPAAMLARPCGACHGTFGVSAGGTMPTLAGQSERYLLLAMKQYARGERPSTVMGRLARGYSESELAALAGYFSRLRPPPAAGDAEAAKVARGRQIHDAECERCHQEGGRRFEFERWVGPVLAGQQIEYLSLAMEQFVFRDRDMPTQMGLKFIGHTQADFEALAHYYAAQAR